MGLNRHSLLLAATFVSLLISQINLRAEISRPATNRSAVPNPALFHPDFSSTAKTDVAALTCDNVTDPGTIGYGQTICGNPADPDPLVSLSPASGGSGDLEYQWLAYTLECPNNLNLAIPGATQPGYDPGLITQPTWFLRCARRAGCTLWIESNCIFIDVDDQDPPDITISAQDATAECADNDVFAVFQVWLDSQGGAEATDHCSAFGWSNDFGGSFNPECGEEISVTFSATDAFGNVSTTEAIFSFIDTQEPVLIGVDPDTNAECDNIPPAASVTANDICDTDVLVLYDELVLPLPDCGGDGFQLVRNWLATDDCGNTAEATQIVHVIDETPPVLLGVPSDIELACDDVVPPADALVTATDNCDTDVEIVFDEQIVPGSCPGAYTILRTWVAIDNCGNEQIQSQTILIGDNTAPEFSFVPGDQSGLCPGQPVFDLAEATDECDQVIIDFTDDIISGPCSQSFTIVRTWIASDACDNTNTATSSFTVSDDSPPILTGVPPDITVDLGAGETLPPDPDVFATDFCDPNVELVLDVQEIPNDCGYLLVKTWTANDDCGNFTDQTQTITVIEGFAASISGASVLCAGTSTTLLVEPNIPGATYNWTSNGGQLNNTNTGMPEFSSDQAGTYVVEVAINAPTGCAETEWIITVLETPQLIASGNGPVCEGETIELAASGGNLFSWTGPNNFTSGSPNPVIDNATLDDAGAYTVTTIAGECPATQTVVVEVNSSPVVTVQGETNLSFGDPLELTATGGNLYSWVGPNNFSASEATIFIPNITAANAGTYMVTVTDFNGCEKLHSVLVTISGLSIVNLEASSNAPLCVGQTLELYATSGGGSYFWEGPNNFTSTDQNPVISNVTLDYDGQFTVTVVGGSCPGVAETDVLVKAFLDGVIESNSPVCEGETIELFASGGTGVHWLGPNNFSSNDDDPSITNAEPADEGVYTAIVYSGICTDTVTTFVEVDEDCDDCIPPSITNVVVLETLCGQSLGSVMLEVEGSSADFDFFWQPDEGTPQGNGNDRTDLPAGVYQVTIAHENDLSCLSVIDVLVGITNGPVLDAIAIEPATCEAENGSVTLLPDDYEYTWLFDNSTDNSRDDLASGPYDIMVVDPNEPDCEDFITVFVGEVNNLFAEAVIDQQPDCGDNNGIVSINVIGGTPGNLSYQWTNGGDDETEFGLEAGSYGVQVTDDGTSCIYNLIFTLTDNVGTAEVTVDDFYAVSCFGSEDAEADFSIDFSNDFDGPPTVLIVDVNGNTYQNGNLDPGQYCVEVWDINNCLAGGDCFNVTEPEPLNIDIELTLADCDNNGAIDITVSGGNVGYAYDWEDLPGNNNPADRPNLPPGVYHLTVTDNNGCTAVASNLDIDDCEDCVEPEVTSTEVDDASCGEEDGSITLNTSEDPSMYDFDWDPDLGQPNADGNSRSDLSAGTYDITISDENDPTCFTEVSVTVGSVGGPQVNIESITPADCDDNNGNAVLSPPSLDYEWSDNGTGATRTDLEAGSYEVTATDPQTGCNTVLTVEIPANNNLIVTIQVNNLPDCGEANGSVTADVGGGSGDYDYSWGNSDTNDNLEAGTYTLTVTDNQTGCTTVEFFALVSDVPGVLVDLMDNVVSMSCSGANDGTVVFFLLFDPNFNGPEEFSIVDPDGNEYTNGQLTPGSYCILIHDADGCLAGAACFDVVDPPPIEINWVVEPFTCQEPGSILLNVSGGTGDLLFDWADLPGIDNDEDRFGLNPGNYSVTVIDDNGCTASANMTVGDDCGPLTDCETPEVTSIASEEATCGNNDGFIVISLSGDEAADYTYTWLPDVSNSNEAIGLASDVYRVTITDINDDNCFTTLTIGIGNSNGPQAEILSITPTTCDQENGTAVLSPTNYAYDWCNGWGGFNGLNLPPGICYVTVTNPATGCSNIIEVEVEAINILDVELQIDALPDCNNNNGEVTINVSGGSASYVFAWSDGGNTQNRTGLEAGMYSVTVTDLGATNCTEVVTFVLLNEVNAGATVDLDANPVVVDCPGDDDGFIDYTVDLDPGFDDPHTAQIVNDTNEVVTNGNLSPGDYCVVVIDDSGCLAGSECFVVEEPDPILVSAATWNKTCDTTGVIDLTVSGGTGPYTFDWQDLPGTDDPEDRTGLEADSYQATITDDNGCTAVINGLAIIDLCAGCPSPDTVEIILPVFTTDSFCMEIEPCMDSMSIIFELMTGGTAGGSLNGIWSLHPNGCLYYTSNGPIGEHLDTIYVIGDDNGLMDTTCVLVTVVPPCFGLIGLDSVETSTFDCDAGGVFCIPVPVMDIGLYGFTDNGAPYTNGFAGCAFQTQLRYDLQTLFDVAPSGPYSLDSWIINNDTFSIDTFFTIGQLVDSMNVWDVGPVWSTGTNNTIAGGFLNNTYGQVVITQLISNLTVMIDIVTIEIPVETEMMLDTGYHELIMTELTTGCMDTIHVQIHCDPCPEMYSGPLVVETVECDDLTPLCLNIGIDEADDFMIYLDGMEYDDGLVGCDFDSLYTYLAVDFANPGNYTLDSWIFDGTPYSISQFSELQELVDSMNVWDPTGNWTTNGVLILGGDLSNDYGSLSISSFGLPIATVDPVLQLTPNAAAILLDLGIHEVIVENTTNICADTFEVEVVCVACEEYSGPETIFVFDCDETAELCLPIPVNNIGNYVFTENGTVYTGATLGCDFDSLITYLAIDFSTVAGYTVDSFYINNNSLFLGFFTTLDELVFWMNNVDPGGNWSVNGVLIVGGDPANTYGNLVVSENGVAVATVSPALQLVPNGIALEFSLGDYQIVAIDTVIGCMDTIDLSVECLTGNQPDTIYLDILTGFTDTFCLDLSYLPGDLDTIYDFCFDDMGFEVNALITLLEEPLENCIEYIGLEVGLDTACLAFCDLFGNCDTLYVIVEVVPPMIDTIYDTVILTETDTICFDVSELPGDEYTLTNYCDDLSGDYVDFSPVMDTFCVSYTGLAVGVDTACFELCDQLGYCDTTILIIETVIDTSGIGPIAVDDDTTGMKGQLTIIDVVDNDTLNGDLAGVEILTDPINGTAIVNPDFTISYIPDVDFCGFLDSFEYILITSSGMDTATVVIDVFCDELTVYTGFSPNGDGVNDFFTILGIRSFPDNEVRVYNRWGNEVFSRKEYTNTNGWDGTWNGKSLPDGTYFYRIDDGEGRVYSGYVQISR